MFKRKKPVVVKCYNKEELGRLLNWLREDEGLSQMNRQRYSVTAVMTMRYWDNPNELMYFEVSIPYFKFKQLRDKYIEIEAFDPILQQQPVAEVLGRSL